MPAGGNTKIEHIHLLSLPVLCQMALALPPMVSTLPLPDACREPSRTSCGFANSIGLCEAISGAAKSIETWRGGHEMEKSFLEHLALDEDMDDQTVWTLSGL